MAIGLKTVWTLRIAPRHQSTVRGLTTRMNSNTELLVRHNLDVMHVAKHICESILCTLLDISGKTKDGLNAYKDLEDWDIQHDLHPYVEGMKTYLPAAPHSLSKIEKKYFVKEATTVYKASAKDNAQVVDVVAYYGVITDIILLDYHNFQIPLFKCDWTNKGHGVKAPPRGYYELEMYDEKEDTTCVLENMLDKNIEDYNDGVTYRRIDCEDILSHFHETEASRNPPKTHLTSPMSVKAIPNITKCKMLDLEGSDTVVAEGRWSSSDPNALVHHIPLGHNSVRVWVDIARQPLKFLWKVTPYMITIEESVRSTIAWPTDRVIICDFGGIGVVECDSVEIAADDGLRFCSMVLAIGEKFG
ncbi:hypothetical protein WN943_025112 [Citrus x changshan-huyou]